MKEGKKAKKIVSPEDLFLADEALKTRIPITTKPPKKGTKKSNRYC
jgi:hypothetical protein